MKIKVAVLFGGRSVEHEVSVISAIQAIMSMDADKYEIHPIYITKSNEMFTGRELADITQYKNIPALLKKSQRIIMLNENGRVYLESYPFRLFGNIKQEIDVAFPIVHGTNVEDGTLQGFLKTLGIPFVGCDVTASAIGMDKYIMKSLLKDNGIPVLDCLCFLASEYADLDNILERVEGRFAYPVIVKPVNLGSSVGIKIAKDRAELAIAIEEAFCYAGRILIEPAITRLREINCSVLGDEASAIASECEEPIHTDDILSYKDKYMGGSKGSQKGMAGVSRRIPADISSELRKEIQELSIKAFRCMGCAGVSRIDFMIDEATGSLYFNEINTIPGSLAFYLWEATDISYKELLDRLIALALKRKREEANITFTFDTNILDNQGLRGLKGGLKGSKAK